MVTVFITDIREQAEATRMLSTLERDFPAVQFNFDLDYTEEPFPCGHTILRAEGMLVEPERIISLISSSGFRCGVLEDKVCG